MDMNELKLKHAEELIVLYKEIKELKKDIDYLKNEYEPLKKGYGKLIRKLCEGDIFGYFCKLHIEEKPSEYGNLKIGFVTDLFKQWFSNEFHKPSPSYLVLKEYLEEKYGKYPSVGWSNISIKEEYHE
jgi:hypothetical protein